MNEVVAGRAPGRPRKRERKTAPPVTVSDVLSFVDTITVRLFSAIPPIEFSELAASLRGNLDSPKKRRLVSRTHLSRQDYWMHLLAIHQPSLWTLDVLRRVGASFAIVEVHVALDLLVGSKGDASALATYVGTKITKPRCQKRPMTLVREAADGPEPVSRGNTDPGDCTLYIDRLRRSCPELTLYADHPTKTQSGKPCLHVEWRIRGSRQLKRAGLNTLEGIEQLDHRTFWDERLQLFRAPDAQTLNGAFGNAGCTLDSTELLRVCSYRTGKVVTHDLMAELVGVLRYHQARVLFGRIDHAWMLPSPENALWD